MFIFVLINDSIAQQKKTGTAEGVLRASQGRIYPPWSLMLAPILASHECRARHTEEAHFRLKIKRAGILFSMARIHRWSRLMVIG
jgi:hypothetical protein